MTSIEVITLIIALYGAFISTFILLDRFTRVSVDYGIYIFATEDKLMHFVLSIDAVNRGKKVVYIKNYGLLIDDDEIELQLIPKSLVSSYYETHLSPVTNQLVSLKGSDVTLIRDAQKLQPGQSCKDYFFSDPIKQHQSFNKSKELQLYVITENGRKFKTIIKTEKFKFMTTRYQQDK